MSLTIKQILPNGDSALLIQFKNPEQGLSTIHALADDFMNQPLPDLINVIPATENLVLVFAKPVNHKLNWNQVLAARIDNLVTAKQHRSLHEIPVCYEADLAADLNQVCQQLQLTIKELITAHTENTYQVTMLGFLPGFTYLSENNQRLELPRKNSPNLTVPAGSVAIANGQTGLYALSSPGGWHVIGRTPMPLLDWRLSPANIIKPMDQVRFKAIDKQAYQTLLLENEH